MRTLIGCAMLLITCFGAAQTSQEFHSRYGESDTERFKIRDGIGLTVLYGSDGFACQIEIKPHGLIVQRPQQKLMAPEVVDGIINGVVPLRVGDVKLMSCTNPWAAGFRALTTAKTSQLVALRIIAFF